MEMSTDMSPIMTLPEELRGLIFNKVQQSEILNLRLVCREWNKNVNDYFDFDIKMLNEDDTPSFQNILQLRIKNLEIGQLLKISVLNSDGTSIFKHPNVIRQLLISEEGLGPSETGLRRVSISPTNLQLLLKICAKSLQDISLDLTSSVYTYQFPPNIRYDFVNLKSLEIILRGNNPDVEENPNSLLRQLENSSMPKLTSLKVHFYFWGFQLKAKSVFVNNIFQLIAKHARFLKTLWLEIDGMAAPYPETLPLQGLAKLNRLEDIYINVDAQGQATTAFWQDLICNQKHLMNVQINKRRPPLSPVPIHFCHNLALNNSASLISLHIEYLRIRADEPPFDLSIFKDCHNLQYIRLTRDTKEPRTIPDAHDLVNFNTLPQNVTTLFFNALHVLSSELLTAFSTTLRFRKLQQLHLLHCGETGMLGVTGTALEQMMNREGSNLIDIRIKRGFNSSDAEELEKLNSIMVMTGVGYSVDEVGSQGFVLKRDSVQDPWPNYES